MKQKNLENQQEEQEDMDQQENNSMIPYDEGTTFIEPVETLDSIEVQQEERRKGRDNKTWGKNIIHDPTNSGIGEELIQVYWNERPNPKDKKLVNIWKEKINELVNKYNEILGFECWGHDFPEPYNND